MKGVIVFVAALMLSAVVLFSIAWSYAQSKLSLVTQTAPEDFEHYEQLHEDIIAEEQALAEQIAQSEPEVEVIETPQREPLAVAESVRSRADVINILLVGTDTTSWKNSRSDAMIIMSVDTTDNTVRLASLLRDTYVSLGTYKGREHEDQKLTHAFALGGAGLLIQTVERNFGVEIDHYVRVNFSSFPKIIDSIGGVGIYLSDAEAEYLNSLGYSVTSGNNWVGGSTALAYSRIRAIDSDKQRARRQQKLLMAIANSARSSSLSNLNDTVTELCSMVQTDMSSDQIISLTTKAFACLDNIDNFETRTFPENYTGKIISGMWIARADLPSTARSLQSYLYD